MDSGIHIHARPEPGSPKELDFTYRAARLVGNSLPPEGIVVNEIDAIYFLVVFVWLTAKDNPFFARNVVHRFWGNPMGRGLVEPLDDKIC